jgi:ferric-dicitrate binding protein FerR (iron transport regulator)
MNHPTLEELTGWVHDLLGTADALRVKAHVAGCAGCRDQAKRLREEARALAQAIAPDERLAALRNRILEKAGLSRRPRGAGLFWQVPLAAAVLLGLLAVFLSPGPSHRLIEGRVAFPDGVEVSAPHAFPVWTPWRIRAKEKSKVAFSDRSTAELSAGTEAALCPDGPGGVPFALSSGDVAFVVVHGPNRFSVRAPSGKVQCEEGRFLVRIVEEKEGGTPMKSLIGGTLVTVIAGSVSLSNALGQISAEPGRSAVMAAREAPLLVAAPQDAEALLKRLEQLVARVSKLEEEIGRLEARNKQLKEQLQSTGSLWTVNPGGGTVRVIQGGPGGAAPGQPIIIELEERARELKSVEKKEK